MKFKDYIWPQDPHTYRETVSREPLYVTQNGETSYNGISSTHRIITGSGVFYGMDAYDNFKTLVTVAADSSPGELFHPVWGKRYCYFTKLEFTQGPAEDLISYSFEFIQAESDGTVPK